MEELSLKYAKILIVFIIVIAVSSITVKNHIKTITDAKKKAEVLKVINKELEKQALEEQQAPSEENIKQVKIAEESQTTTEQNYNNTQSQDIRANNFESKGIRYMAEGNYDEAIYNFEQAFEIGSLELKRNVFRSLADCYRQKNDISGVINTYNKMLPYLQDAREINEINSKLATSYIEIGDKEQALARYEANYSMGQSVYDLINVADLLVELNYIDKLRDYIQTHITNFPQDEQTLQKYTDIINSENIQQ